MRWDQTHGSTHHHFGRGFAPACLEESSGVAALAVFTVVGGCSVVGSISLSLSCVPSLHDRYSLPRYYERSDFPEEGFFGPPAGMNTPSGLQGSSLLLISPLPAILSPTIPRVRPGFVPFTGFISTPDDDG